MEWTVGGGQAGCLSHRQNDLEAEIGAEAQTEIVMGAVVEVDFVTYIETKAQRAEVAFQACAGIKNAADVVSAEIVHAAEEGAQSSRRVAQTKVNAAGFKGYEGTNAAVAEVELGTNFPVEDAHTGARESDCARSCVGEPFGEDLIKIVAHLRFKLERTEHRDAEPGA